ncbi:hypothetical protein [Sphingomonas sp. IC4-52]|uniref:hypothetical protein n=1 Tax=Sphingomonas sp. IC4-52 TaxID=2887202 RepID=UPI001D11D261|nr:hypothetical protein [Sphingomonas sp. IC4-52]MCC2981746.1 hypothetical protein [Sphingomonas sp. IC4-52]
MDGGSVIDRHNGGCSDDEAEPCPICRGEELDPDFVARIEQAGAQPGMAMTFDEAMAWLRAR